MKSGIGVSVLVVGAMHYSLGVGATLSVRITVCFGLCISMWLDGPLDKVWTNEVRIGKIRCRCTMVG
jgi:hypothetical protein